MSKVSVIISNRNDIAMLIVTIRSCIEEMRPLGKGEGEVVVCDNSDPAVYEKLKSAIPSGYQRDGTLKVIRQDYPCLFTAREAAIKAATGDYIMCLDSHMLVGRDSIVNLAAFMDCHKRDPELGFAHAPITWAHHHESRARHDRDLARSELGPWGKAYDVEKTITWKGMPWMCRRRWFLDRRWGLGGYGALAQHRVSWGGGDMHIGVKPWLLGFKNWAVPTNACIHIGPFPKLDLIPGAKDSLVPAQAPNDPYKYRLYGTSGNFPHTFGFLVSCYVLGGEPMMERNKKMLNERFGRYLNTGQWWKKAIELGKDEKEWLDSRKKMTFEEFLERKPWNSN